MSQPTFTFWEGNNCTQDNLGSVPADQNGQWDLKASGAPIKNDEARSCTISNVAAGVVLELFDSADASKRDDWAEIHMLQPVSSMCIGTFEQNIDTPTISMTYHPSGGIVNNGLDGKVSNIKVKVS